MLFDPFLLVSERCFCNVAGGPVLFHLERIGANLLLLPAIGHKAIYLIFGLRRPVHNSTNPQGHAVSKVCFGLKYSESKSKKD